MQTSSGRHSRDSMLTCRKLPSRDLRRGLELGYIPARHRPHRMNRMAANRPATPEESAQGFLQTVGIADRVADVASFEAQLQRIFREYDGIKVTS